MLPSACMLKGVFMFRIGEFSRFSRVSVKMLRHYDEIGLLPPDTIDAATGYRYYTADQLPRLNQIILLKDLGFSLEAIANLLDADLAPEEIQGVLKLRHIEVQRQLDAERQRLAHLDAALAHLDETAALPQTPILLRTLSPQLMLTLRRQVTEEEISTLFDLVEATAALSHKRAPTSPLLIYHDAEFSDRLLDVEAAVPITEEFARVEPCAIRWMDGGEMACILYTGDYAAADGLIQRYPAWLETHGYEAAGPLRECYLRFGADGPGYALPAAWLAETPAAYVTELQLPVRTSQRIHGLA